MVGIMGLISLPAAVEGNNAPYPKEKLAEFVIEKLDVTTLPTAIRLKRESGKKTFAEYGYVTLQIAEKEAIVEGAGDSEINIRILEEKPLGLYVCIGSQRKSSVNSRV